MDLLTVLVHWLQGVLGASLLYLLAVVLVDLVLGIINGHVLGAGFTLRRLADFTVTTLGFQKTVAFLGAVLLLYLRREPITEAGVAALAMLYATAVLPDIYDKVSSLFFSGALPLSRDLRPPAPPAVVVAPT